MALPAVLLMAATGPATAHTALATAIPAIGGEVDVVTEIVLEYEGPLAEDETHAIRLLAPDAETVIVEGDARVRSDRIIALAVDAELPGNGQYLVDWAIVAADGDEQASRYAFTYTGADGEFVVSAPEEATERPGPADADEDDDGLSRGSAVAVGTGVAVAIFAAVLARRRRESDE